MRTLLVLLTVLSASCASLPVSRAASELQRLQQAYELYCLTKPPVSVSVCNELSDKIAKLK
jgi:hypothetical protein